MEERFKGLRKSAFLETLAELLIAPFRSIMGLSEVEAYDTADKLIDVDL